MHMQLAHRIREMEERHATQSPACAWQERRHAVLKTGWHPAAQPLDGFPSGLHEWLGVADPSCREERARRGGWRSPLCILVHLARQIVRTLPAQWIVWIGERCFPYPAVFREKDHVLERSLFVAADNADLRVWAIDVALRCSSVGAVIADGSGMTMGATRRIQLVSQARQK